VQLTGLAALPQPKFNATPLQPATPNHFSLQGDKNPDDIYTNPSSAGKSFVMVPFSTLPAGDGAHQALLFIVEVANTTAPQLNLYAGVDYNGDGLPSAEEQTCESSSTAGTTMRCVVDLRIAQTGNVWFLVEHPSPSGDTTTYTVDTTSAVVQGGLVDENQVPTQHLLAVGPGHTSEDQAFPLRLSWADGISGTPALVPGRHYGAVQIVVSASGGDGGLLPVGLTRIAGNDDTIHPLGPADNRVIESGETLSHQFIDVNGTGTMQVSTQLLGGTGSVAFYAIRTDFPPSSSSPAVDAAPAADAAATRWSISPTTTQSTAAFPVTPGRWYIVAAASGGEATMVIQPYPPTTPNTAPTSPGSYFNPDRSGHGIFVSQAAGQQVVYWYSYLEDGTPAWYSAQGAAPAADATSWSAWLRRVTWDGSALSDFPIVGDVLLTPIDGDNLMFTWNLFGVNGSERFTVLSRNACVSVGGQSVGLSGQWFAPSQSGYGMDVVADPQQQFDAFYLYDALGEPRWLVGSGSPFMPTMSIALNQVSGFCPTCAYTATTLQPVGTLNVSYANALSGSFATNVTLAAPLSGAFDINQPTSRLTGSTTCQ
jgi:hypothetical protein